jgi:hypothetical protein
MNAKRIILTGTILLLAATAAAPALAGVHGRVVVGPRYYYGPYYGHPVYAVAYRPVPALPRWAGTIDFDVKPNKSAVYVDGVRIGVADSFDGWPDAFHTRAGKHRIKLVSPDGRVYTATVMVQPGRETNVRVKFPGQ